MRELLKISNRYIARGANESLTSELLETNISQCFWDLVLIKEEMFVVVIFPHQQLAFRDSDDPPTLFLPAFFWPPVGGFKVIVWVMRCKILDQQSISAHKLSNVFYFLVLLSGGCILYGVIGCELAYCKVLHRHELLSVTFSVISYLRSQITFQFIVQLRGRDALLGFGIIGCVMIPTVSVQEWHGW